MRVEVSAKFASMPTRTPVHTFTVNSMSPMQEMFHLIRFLWKVKGLFWGPPGHMAQQPGTQTSLRSCDRNVIRLASSVGRNEIELPGVLP